MARPDRHRYGPLLSPPRRRRRRRKVLRRMTKNTITWATVTATTTTNTNSIATHPSARGRRDSRGRPKGGVHPHSATPFLPEVGGSFKHLNLNLTPVRVLKLSLGAKKWSGKGAVEIVEETMSYIPRYQRDETRALS